MSRWSVLVEEEGCQHIRLSQTLVLGTLLFTMWSCANTQHTSHPTGKSLSGALVEKRKEVSALKQKELQAPLFEDLRYPLTDAAPVGESGFFVGNEFDFSIAMMMPALGAGLAAKKRREKNEAIAELLKEKVINLPKLLEKKLVQHAPFNGSKELAVLGLFFGEPTVGVQIHVAARETPEGESGKFLWRITYASQVPGLFQFEGDSLAYVDHVSLNKIVNKAVDEIVKVVARRVAEEVRTCDETGLKYSCTLGGNQKTGDIYSVDNKMGLFCDLETGLVRFWICPGRAKVSPQAAQSTMLKMSCSISVMRP